MNEAQPHRSMREDDRPLVRVDVRRRVSLGGATGVKHGDTFLLAVGDDGTLTLTPARTVPIGTLGFDDPTSD